MTTANILKLTTVSILINFFVNSTAISSTPCPDSLFQGDNVLDLTTFGKHLEELYDLRDSKNQNAKYDMRRKVDRHNINSNNPMYALHAIGKVTLSKTVEGDSNFEQFSKIEENKSWGTGFMISPCHMITNYHVICEKVVLPNGKKVCKNNESVLNKSANFSFGENEDGSDFAKRVTGKVVAFHTTQDYAIVRIDSLKKSDESIPYIYPNFSNISEINNKISLGAGFPSNSIKENSHKIYAMKTKLKDNGYFVDGKMTFTPGNSGSPTLYLKDDALVASGLFNKYSNDSDGKPSLNTKPTVISMATIGASLREKNSQTYKEISDALIGRSCN